MSGRPAVLVVEDDSSIQTMMAATLTLLGLAKAQSQSGPRRCPLHDGRHTALTRMAEDGQPDWVIQAQLGHVSPHLLKTYSHIRRKALDEAAAVLEAPDIACGRKQLLN